MSRRNLIKGINEIGGLDEIVGAARPDEDGGEMKPRSKEEEEDVRPRTGSGLPRQK